MVGPPAAVRGAVGVVLVEGVEELQSAAVRVPGELLSQQRQEVTAGPVGERKPEGGRIKAHKRLKRTLFNQD